MGSAHRRYTNCDENSFVMAFLQSHVLIQLQAVAMKILEISRNSTSDSEKENTGNITHIAKHRIICMLRSHQFSMNKFNNILQSFGPIPQI